MRKAELIAKDGSIYTVKGSTSGMKDGWLSWKDKDGATGLSRPGSWRWKDAVKRNAKAKKAK
mgnify:CR=1 FL=1